MMIVHSLSVIFMLFCSAFAQLNVETIYEDSPKLKITGARYHASSDLINIKLEIGLAGGPNLIMGSDFKLVDSDDGYSIILELQDNKRWSGLSHLTQPSDLILSGVFIHNSRNILPAPKTVAHILMKPTINWSGQLINQHSTKELVVKGSGLKGVKKLDLILDPFLKIGVDFDVMSEFPLKKDEFILRLRNGQHWRTSTGPLYISSIDTGAGFLGFDKILIANVNSDSLIEVPSMMPTSFPSTELHLGSQKFGIFIGFLIGLGCGLMLGILVMSRKQTSTTFLNFQNSLRTVVGRIKLRKRHYQQVPLEPSYELSNGNKTYNVVKPVQVYEA